MDLRLKTDLTSEPLSAKDLKPYIKYEDSDVGEIDLIDKMIVAVRTLFEKRTGLSFAKKVYECYFLKGDKPYILPLRPIVSVDKVETVDYLNDKTELELNSGYFKKGLYEIEIITSSVTTALLVTFTVGYGETETENLPGDLIEAMKRQVAQWYDNRDDFRELELLGSIEGILSLYIFSL